MTLSADQAKTIADYTLADYENECAATKRVIGAIPDAGLAYTPDAKSMTALDLAWHTASAEWFFLNSVCEGQFSAGESKRPENIRNSQDVISWYDKNVPPVLARAKGLSGQHLAKPIDFFGKMQAPAVMYLTMMVKHGVHHRGQLSTYLRPAGSKVPSIYGPSADTQ
jgi:uncharacterized damage-inducible protein DinB